MTVSNFGLGVDVYSHRLGKISAMLIALVDEPVDMRTRARAAAIGGIPWPGLPELAAAGLRGEA
jgi:hypothetical protein